MKSCWIREGKKLRCRHRLRLRKLENAEQTPFLDQPSDPALRQADRCRDRHSVERIPHSWSLLYDAAEAKRNDVKVVQDLLRHASYKLTMGVYDDVVSSGKREAHSGVILLTSNRTQAEDGRMASA